MSATAARRSWKPVSRMVLWQLQKTPTVSSGMRGMSTIMTSSNTLTSATSCISGSTIGRSFIRASSSSWMGVGGKRSSLISPSHVRFSGNSSSAAAQQQEKGEDQQERKKPSDMSEEDWLAENDLVKSDYWGVTTKNFRRADGTKWQWHEFMPGDTYKPDVNIDYHKHREPTRWEEKFAWAVVQLVKKPTVWFYNTRYGCRAMMLETVAAVPGMVGGMLLHLRSLRKFEQSGGWIKALLDEAENERMHLMTLLDLVQPVWYERFLVVAVQGVFFNFYFMLYVLSPRLAHRVTGYLEEEAIISYTTYLDEIDKGNVENVPAPGIAIDYWKLPKDAKLRDMITALRADEAHHRDVNHYAADIRNEGKQLHQAPAPISYH